MRNHYPPESALDHAIDRVVHEMAQRTPRPGFTRRVLRQIEELTSGPHVGWTISGWQQGLAALAALLVVAAASLLLRSQESQPAPSPQVVTNPSTAPTLPRAEPRTVLRPAPRAARTAPRREPSPEAIFGTRRDRVAAATVPVNPTSAEEVGAPFAPLEPQATSPVAPITISPIEVTPIEIQRITMPSLPPHERGVR